MRFTHTQSPTTPSLSFLSSNNKPTFLDSTIPEDGPPLLTIATASDGSQPWEAQVLGLRSLAVLPRTTVVFVCESQAVCQAAQALHLPRLLTASPPVGDASVGAALRTAAAVAPAAFVGFVRSGVVVGDGLLASIEGAVQSHPTAFDPLVLFGQRRLLNEGLDLQPDLAFSAHAELCKLLADAVPYSFLPSNTFRVDVMVFLGAPYLFADPSFPIVNPSDPFGFTVTSWLVQQRITAVVDISASTVLMSSSATQLSPLPSLSTPVGNVMTVPNYWLPSPPLPSAAVSVLPHSAALPVSGSRLVYTPWPQQPLQQQQQQATQPKTALRQQQQQQPTGSVPVPVPGQQQQAQPTQPQPQSVSFPAASPAPSPPPFEQPADHVHDHSGEMSEEAQHMHAVKDGETIVTMFVTLVPANSNKLKYWVQMNTIRAMQLQPGVEVVVFSKDAPVKAAVASQQLDIEVVSEFDTNKYGTPFLKSMFQHVEHHASSRMFGYANGDILFCTELVHSLKAVLAAVDSGQLSKRVLVIGKRFNLKMPATFNRDDPYFVKTLSDVDWVNHLAKADSVAFQDNAQDFFIITPGTFVWERVKNFVVGRPGYDNWLVAHAFRDGIDTVDVTATLHAVHQTGPEGNMAGHVPRPDKTWNTRLVREHEYQYGVISKALFETKRLAGDKVIVVDKRSVPHMKPLWVQRDRLVAAKRRK